MEGGVGRAKKWTPKGTVVLWTLPQSPGHSRPGAHVPASPEDPAPRQAVVREPPQ